MNKNTPPKHKTPNYRLVQHKTVLPAMPLVPSVELTWYDWEPMPLRSDRKDL